MFFEVLRIIQIFEYSKKIRAIQFLNTIFLTYVQNSDHLLILGPIVLLVLQLRLLILDPIVLQLRLLILGPIVLQLRLRILDPMLHRLHLLLLGPIVHRHRRLMGLGVYYLHDRRRFHHHLRLGDHQIHYLRFLSEQKIYRVI